MLLRVRRRGWANEKCVRKFFGDTTRIVACSLTVPSPHNFREDFALWNPLLLQPIALVAAAKEHVSLGLGEISRNVVCGFGAGITGLPNRSSDISAMKMLGV